MVICVAFLARQRGGRSGGLAVCHGRDLLAGALPLQDFTDSGTAGLLGRIPGALPVLVLQAEHVMGQAAEALGAHGPAALVGIGLEGPDGLGDRQRPRCRGRLGPCRCCGVATDPGAVGGALYTPPWVNWGPPVRRPLLGRSRNRAALCAVSERETGITFELTPPP